MSIASYVMQLLQSRRGQKPAVPDQTMLPAQGREVTLENGSTITMMPDGTIWSGENRETPVGRADPQTMRIEPNWLALREQARTQERPTPAAPGPAWGKTLEYALYPLAATGMAMRELGKVPTREELIEAHGGWGGLAEMPKLDYPLKEYLPGGKGYQEYRELPIGEQLLYEAPALAALSLIPGAAQLRAGLAPAAAKGSTPAALATDVLLPVAGAEAAVGVVLKYGIAIPLKYTARGFTKVGTKAFEKVLDAGLDRWVATQARMDPRYRSKFANFVTKDHDWLVEKATNHMLKRQAEVKAGKMSAGAAQKAAAEDTIKEVQTRFLALPESKGLGKPMGPPLTANTKVLQKPFKSVGEFEQEITTGKWAVVSAANPGGITQAANKNAVAMAELREQLLARGYNPSPTIGRYGEIAGEPAFLIRGMPEEEALEWARACGQESVLVPNKLLYTDKSYIKAPVSKLDISVEQTANYTELMIGGKLEKWSVPLEGERVYLLEHYGPAGRTVIKPSASGTGQAGSEAAIYRDYPDLFEKGLLAKRSYYYVEGATPEPRFKGQPKYNIEAELKLYDPAAADKEALAAFKAEKVKVLAKIKKAGDPNFGNTTQQGAEIEYAAARDLGYDGYIKGDRVAVFKELPVKAIPEKGKIIPKAAPVTAAVKPTAIAEEITATGPALMADLQPTAEALEIATRPDLARAVANLPGFRRIAQTLSPGTVANTPEAKALYGWAMATDEGANKTNFVMSHLHQLGTQEQVFGKLTEGNVIAAGPLKGLDVNSICEYPGRYADKLTSAQKAWIKAADEVEHAKLAFLKRNGINVNELSMEEGGNFVGRRYYARVVDGNVLDVGSVAAGPRRPGGKLGLQKARTFETPKEALDAGYHALPRDETLALNVQGAYNSAAIKQSTNWLLEEVAWRTTGAPEELVLAAEAAIRRLHRSKQLLAALNRAVRGERITAPTIKSIADSYPKQAERLKTLVTQLQAKAPQTAEEVQRLTKEAKALINKNITGRNTAVNARARARERAMAPRVGEAAVGIPALSGKIFTGPEAQTLAATLAKGFGQEASGVLSEINKVNAIGRYFMLAGDASPLTIQLIFLAGAHPKIYAGTAEAFVQALLNPKYHAGIVAKNAELLNKYPTYLSTRQGTEFTDVFAKGGLFRVDKLIPKDEAFLKTLGLLPIRAFGKLGQLILSPFQRGFEGCLDFAGIGLLKAHNYMAVSPKAIADIGQHVNIARGLTSSARLGVSRTWQQAETATILAARYNRSIAAIIFDFFQGNLRGKLARDYILKGTAGIILASIAFSFARGEDLDEIIDHLNICSPNFVTWTIGGTRIGPGSKIRSVLRLLGQTAKDPENMALWGMDNPALRFVRGNLSPVAGASVDLLTGKDYIGDPTRDNFPNFFDKILASNLLPIWLQQVLLEGGNIQQKLIAGAAEFMGGRGYPESEWDVLKRMRDQYAQADYERDYADLNRGLISDLERKHPDLAKAEAEADTTRAEQGTDLERWYYETKDFVIKQRNDNLEFAAKALLDKKISRYDYDNQRKYIRPHYSGAMATLWSARESLDPQSVHRIEKWVRENQKQEDKDLADYQEYYSELLGKSDLPVDWDEIDKKLEQRIAAYSKYSQQYVRYMKDGWIRDLPPAARQIEELRLAGIADETWWDDYRGKAGSEKATTKPPAPAGVTDYINRIIEGR